ncbi:MAG: hypothetical protein GY702_24685 [Desulfobulbaceae bacterium]|nr:hypothetical protein [Desulfobulbaceae bacterium]
MCLTKAFTLNDVERINSLLQGDRPETPSADQVELRYVSRDKTIIPFDPEKIEKNARIAMAKYSAGQKIQKTV